MQIRVNSVGEVESKGKYSQYTLSFNQDGEDRERVLRSFVNPDVYHLLLKAEAGQAYDIKLEKDGKYWQWTKATLLSGEAATGSGASKARPSGRAGDWETAEERAKKQVYIVRQSSISSAIEMYKAQGKQNIDEGDVILAAREFEAYVFRGDVDIPTGEIE